MRLSRGRAAEAQHGRRSQVSTHLSYYHESDMYGLRSRFHAEVDNRSSRRLLGTNSIIVIFLISAFQSSCCRQSFSYPVIVDVTKIEVTANPSAQLISEIVDNSQINRIIRFIDERRSRWCSPRFTSLPRTSGHAFLAAGIMERARLALARDFLLRNSRAVTTRWIFQMTRFVIFSA